MTNSNPLVIIVGALVTLALIGAVTVLAWHGTINGQAAMTFFGALGGIGGVGAASHIATRTGARAAKRED